jgi:hypothetical protein
MQIPDAVHALDRDLRSIFGARLRSLIAYGSVAGDDRASTLAVVDGLSADDLRACVGRVAAWDDAGLGTPLFVATHEFERSLDAFPFEFGAILADHAVISGADPFVGLRVETSHLRHACEVQARSHLLHLREGFLETRGRSDALAELLLRSAPPLVALLQSVVRLEDDRRTTPPEAAAAIVEQKVGVPPGSLAEITRLVGCKEVPSDDARRLFPPYLDAVQRLTAYVDRWRAA